MPSKDKGGKNSKKDASASLKEKRQAKKAKKAAGGFWADHPRAPRRVGTSGGFCQISDNEALRARDLVVARPPPDSASAVSPPQMAPDFRSLSEI